MITHMKRTQIAGGFTLVEVLVVLAIVGMLLAVIYVNFGEARANARDKQRTAEIEQIALALEVYKQAYGAYPTNTGVVGEGNDIDDALDPFMGTVPHDPLGPGDDDYSYIYDDEFDCDGTDSVIIYAEEMEQDGSKNGASICDDSDIDDAYGKVLGVSP